MQDKNKISLVVDRKYENNMLRRSERSNLPAIELPVTATLITTSGSLLVTRFFSYRSIIMCPISLLLVRIMILVLRLDSKFFSYNFNYNFSMYDVLKCAHTKLLFIIESGRVLFNLLIIRVFTLSLEYLPIWAEDVNFFFIHDRQMTPLHLMLNEKRKAPTQPQRNLVLEVSWKCWNKLCPIYLPALLSIFIYVYIIFIVQICVVIAVIA